MLAPILYDFKRALLRPATLLALLLFVLGGAALSYLVYGTFINMYPQANLYAVAVASGNDTVAIHGIVYDAYGRPVDSATLKLVGGGDTVLAEIRVGGIFHVEVPFGKLKEASKIVVETGSGREEYRLLGPVSAIDKVGFMPLGAAGVSRSLAPGEGGVPEMEIAKLYFEAKMILVSMKSGESVLLIRAVNLTDPHSPPHVVLEYGFAEGGVVSGPREGETGSIHYRRLGVLDDYVAYYRIRVPGNASVLVIRYSGGNVSGEVSITYSFMIPVEAAYAGVVAGSTGISLFAQFFPIIFLYLANMLMAKPRGSGALEFILARPVTRWDIYVTRYSAGALIAVVAPLLFIAAMMATNKLLLGVTMNMDDALVLALGLMGAMTAFYTLSYMLAASIKPGRYLTVSILLYVVFALFWSAIALIVVMVLGAGYSALHDTTYAMAYFNPLGASSIASYLVQRDYGAVAEASTASPWLATLSTLLWITLCFTIGYFRFRSQD